MPASLLKFTNQIDDIQVKNVDYSSTKITFNVMYRPKESVCSACGCCDIALKGVKVRNLRMAPMGDKSAFLSVEIHRQQCTHCRHLWWPIMPFARLKRRITISFEKYVLRLMQFSTIKHVAQFLGVSWGLVKRIHKGHLKQEYKSPDLSEIQYIGIDEFSIKKGHEYMTIFINLESGKIIHAVEGKSINSVAPFLLELKEKAIHLKAMAMDMNAAYESAVKEFLPHVDVVFDRFHVVALLNKAINEIRRDEQAKSNELGLKALKGHRFLLLSNYEKLNSKRQNSLTCLFELNKPLAIAHSMKEQIRLFWSKSSVKEGVKFLCCWVMDAIEAEIKELHKVARTFIRHWKDLLNYFKHRITNGKTEGINNKIKTMKRQAYGFRDMEYFKLRLYNLHTTRYSFV
jgi:transposase